ncbi:hypothetical protein [Arsenicibacter rosenii]|uniref:HEPN domain-containing protein n=1 Tax=Arsenicibacter rosenii TaxID=1750698 RepID=A0A1S2VCG3_9BACT|nr:hypothetical protein [Arsenicibacter rosenii]OIN55618.1 hypothetical protein BLX24_29190 [Arsenicibacter rosenii]
MEQILIIEMEQNVFFFHYLKALSKALENDNINYGYHVHGPDWFIDDDQLRNEIDLFEQTYSGKYKTFLEKVAIYFDAKSHYSKKIGSQDISEYKAYILFEMNEISKKLNDSGV